jgi:hypothetical protein
VVTIGIEFLPDAGSRKDRHGARFNLTSHPAAKSTHFIALAMEVDRGGFSFRARLPAIRQPPKTQAVACPTPTPPDASKRRYASASGW